VRKSDVAFVGIDSRDFAFDEANSPIEHRFPQIERDVFDVVLPERKPDQRWIEKKLSAPRH